MNRWVIISCILLLFAIGCKEETAAVCKDSEAVEKVSVLRCPRCFKQSAAEKVQSVNQHMSVCPVCKKISPTVKFYPRKRK